MFLIIICTRIRPLRSNIPLVLTCHTYLSEIILFLIMIDTCSGTIFGVVNPSISFKGSFCQIRAYFQYICVGNVIYSFVIQAFFRLFRVVLHHRRAFRTLRIFIIAIVIQWIFVCFIYLLFFPLNDFKYVPSEYRCLILFTNYRGSVMVFLFTYIIPTSVWFTIYFFIIRHVRQINLTMQNRQLARKRDLVVLKRIMLLFIVLQLFSMPLAVMWLIYIVSGYLIPCVYQLQGLTVAFSQFFITILIAFETPPIQEKFRWRRRQVQPIVRVRIEQNKIEERIQIQRF